MVSPTPSPSSSTTTVAPALELASRAGPTRTLPIRSIPAETSDLSRNSEERLPDSGYASHESSQAASSNPCEDIGTELDYRSFQDAYVQSLSWLDDREAERRPRFLPSDDGRGGGNGSIFSEHDGQTKASNTTSDPVAQQGIELALSKSKSTRYFPGKIEDIHIERFYVILPSVQRLLLQYVTRKSLLRSPKPYKPMIIRPMMLGPTLLESKPHIVVFCASEMRRQIQKFMDKDELVQTCCRDDSGSGLVTFGIAVCGSAPRLCADDFAVSVVWDTYFDESDVESEKNSEIEQSAGKSADAHDVPASDHLSAVSRVKTSCITCIKNETSCDKLRPTCKACFDSGKECEGYPDEAQAMSDSRDTMIANGWFETKTQFSDTVCGTPIQFRSNGRTSNVTIGGIVKVEYEDGGWDLKGLTAAHAAALLLQDGVSEDSILSDDHGDGEDSCSDTDLESSSSCSDDSVFDLGRLESVIGNCEEGVDPWAFSNPQALGEPLLACPVKALGTETAEDGAFFDWALTSLSIFKMNMVPDRKLNTTLDLITRYRRFPSIPVLSLPEPVMVICGSSGVKRGRLLGEPSKTLICPGSAFTNTYMVELSDGSTLSDGDSGAWVVSGVNLDLLGHIVATDVLGAGYIVSARDIFDDIIRSTSVVAVGLPEVMDVMEKLQNLQRDVRDKMARKQQNQDETGKQDGELPLITTFEDTEHAGTRGPYGDDDDERHMTSFGFRTKISHAASIPHRIIITTSSQRSIQVLHSIEVNRPKDIMFQRVSVHRSGKTCIYTFDFTNVIYLLEAEHTVRKMRDHLERGENVEIIEPPLSDAVARSSAYDDRFMMEPRAASASQFPPQTEASLRRDAFRSGFIRGMTGALSAPAAGTDSPGRSSIHAPLASLDEVSGPAASNSSRKPAGSPPMQGYRAVGESSKFWINDDGERMIGSQRVNQMTTKKTSQGQESTGEEALLGEQRQSV